MPKDNKHITSILESFRKYFDKTIDLEGLERNVYGFVSAIEGDVPRHIRDILEEIASEIELIRYSVEKTEERDAIQKLFVKLRDRVMRAS